MPLSLDKEILAALRAMPRERTALSSARRGDWRTLRADTDAAIAAHEAELPRRTEVARRDITLVSFDGEQVGARWYAPPPEASRGAPGPAVVYLHGGGMISGGMALYDRTVAGYAADSGVPFLAVDYRLAPEHPHPAPVQDCLAALQWLHLQAASLGVDRTRVAVMGDSAGGGLAAATALLARDRDLPLAQQLLIYPMLDDRNTSPDPLLQPFAGWTYDHLYTAWHALLGEDIGTDNVPASAAAARATDLAGVADAYIEVGELDLFRDECVDFAVRLARAGSSVELHVWRGCPHGFDRISPAIGVARLAVADRLRVLREL
jgi:acetyl esterase/lipase